MSQIVKRIVAARAQQPGRVALIYEDDQQVAEWLVDRRGVPVLAILEALEPLKQPGLLNEQDVHAGSTGSGIEAAAPIPLKDSDQ